MSANTIQLHRVLRATLEKVYRAFLDGDAMAKWLPPNGFTGKVPARGAVNKPCLLLIQVNGNKDTNYVLQCDK
jgi:hypothetical protein